MDWQLLFFTLGAYLLGSIPFGLLASKYFGLQDPRKAGSGNIGFTNVLRISGRKAGILTLLGDFGKGATVALLAQRFVTPEAWVLTISFAVIAGHIWSIFLQFKGGKGVATALGVFLGLDVFLGAMAIGIWGITVQACKFSSVGALVSFGVLPILVGIMFESRSLLIFTIGVSVCIFWRHQSNIVRLLRGTETKVNDISS